ncbi:MAG: hypothetical protein ACXAC2_24030 [Candidatus Kariarchaeaceae archaeon]
MRDLSSFQRLELILIPVSFFFSLIFIFLIGLIIIGHETWDIMGVPIILGSIIGIIIVFILKQKKLINSFNQLETLFRILVIIGGVALIPMIIGQMIMNVDINIIFSFLALIFSSLGSIMGITCVLLLYSSNLTLESSK